MRPAVGAWADQVNAHLAVVIPACYRFLDAWEGAVENDEFDPQEAADSTRDLRDAVTLFDSMLKEVPPR